MCAVTAFMSQTYTRGWEYNNITKTCNDLRKDLHVTSYNQPSSFLELAISHAGGIHYAPLINIAWLACVLSTMCCFTNKHAKI